MFFTLFSQWVPCSLTKCLLVKRNSSEANLLRRRVKWR